VAKDVAGTLYHVTKEDEFFHDQKSDVSAVGSHLMSNAYA